MGFVLAMRLSFSNDRAVERSIELELSRLDDAKDGFTGNQDEPLGRPLGISEDAVDGEKWENEYVELCRHILLGRVDRIDLQEILD